LPHGVLFRGGAEERIRRKLLEKGYIDTVIGLPSNLFFSTGIPVCILVLKRCKMSNDVLFINASEYFAKGKRQNRLRTGEDGEPNDIEKIVNTYKNRTEEDRYSKKISIERIEEEGYNLNISRYISTAKEEKKIDLKEENKKLVDLEKDIVKYTKEHNKFLEELGLNLLP
ncbi:N-6 DNA methylase, partial [Sulfurimonas sp.]|uniref:N-6 DNA methylase n=1 Tax=Sulfurimonas sp. TaxID=2022749 RepID=UPI0025DE9245